MNKLVVYVFAGVVFSTSAVFAQPTKYVKAGGNYSYLKELSYGEPGVGHLYGIGKDWRLYRWIQLRSEVLISNSTLALKNRSVHTIDPYDSYPYLSNEINEIYYFDINIKPRYLEIPLLLKVSRSFRKDLSVGLELGYSLKFILRDGSESNLLRKVRTSDLTDVERQNFRFDYRFTGTGENYSYNGRGICPTVGTYVTYSKFQIFLRYQVDYIDWVSSIVIGEDVPLRIFVLSMGYRF